MVPDSIFARQRNLSSSIFYFIFYRFMKLGPDLKEVHINGSIPTFWSCGVFQKGFNNNNNNNNIFIKRQIAKGYEKRGKDRIKIKTTSFEEAKRWVLRACLKAGTLFELLVRVGKEFHSWACWGAAIENALSPAS